MRVRASADLSELDDEALLESLSEGLGHILNNSRRLYESCESLEKTRRFQAALILRNVAEEEASKFLILIDAIRCPRDPVDRWRRQIKRFNDHLAKGLYVASCFWRHAAFGQLQGLLDLHRRAFYLDGPNGVDWIFRNDIEQRREEVIYVDYVSTDEGHRWQTPASYDTERGLEGVRPQTLMISETLASIGISKADGLRTVAEVWREASLSHESTWLDRRTINQTTLEELQKAGILIEQPQKLYKDIIDSWQFPLYNLDLEKLKVAENALREQQRNWSSDI